MAVTKLPTWKSVLGAVAVSSAALLVAAPPALAQDGGGGPDPTSAPVQERVSAEVLPGVVYLKTDVHTYLRNTGSGQLLGPLDFSTSCTGFVVNQNGYIATAGHCVNDDDIRESVAQQVAATTAEDGYDPVQMTNFIIANYKLEGEAAGSPADKKITVVEAGQGQDQTPQQAQIVDSKSNAQGDVALLKVNETNMQTIEVAPPGPVNTGTPIMTIGYPAARDENVDPTLAPTYKEGTVSSQQNRNGIPFMEITADMGHGMSGGPTVNQQGQVVGINSMGTTDELASFNFVAPSTTLLDLMSRNGIRPEAGPADIAFRTGLDEYYQGYYSDAEEDFQKVLDLSPENKSAQELKSKAARAHDQFGDKGISTATWGLIGGGAALVLIAGAATIVLVRRRRGGGQDPAQVAGVPMPTGPAPHGMGGYPSAAQGWNTGTAQPFGPSYSTPVPTMPVGHPQQYGAQPARPFGTSPFGESRPVETGPQSPAVGFPVPVAAAPVAAGPVAAAPVAAAPVAAGPVAAGPVAAGPAAGEEATQRVSRPAAPVAGPTPVQVANGFCAHCGAGRIAGSRFCGTCGAGVS